MGIADFFRPKYRHSDVRVRTEAIKALTSDDAAILLDVAKSDRDIGVRRIAIGKIDAADVLAELAAAEPERSLRDYAGERAAELWQDTACGDDEPAALGALAGIAKLGDQHALVEVTANAALPGIRKKAFGELRDPRALAELAKGDAPQDLRLAAVARIDDGDVLRALAIDTTQKEVGLAAVDKLDDVDRLDHVAQKAKNKAVRQRARKTAAEMAQAERDKQKPVVSDDTKRRRAERAQLIREVEAVAETFDFDRHGPAVKAAQSAWVAIVVVEDAGYAEANERFGKNVERFWKRAELYAQQARSTDELRAIEREAQRERDAARVSAPMVAPVAPVAEVPASAAAPAVAEDAESAARRDERERARVEQAERRAREDAERDARRKDDAERGAQLAVSLAALVDDLEQLGTRDGRAIDRALQQAAKAFEQIGKVPGEHQGPLSDRYTAARGKLVVRAHELREAEDWARFQNVPKAEALINTAKEMAAEEPSLDLANRLRQLQALWKEVGPMPQRRSKELWDQFKTSCDAVYERVRSVRAAETEKHGEVARGQEALIAEAEALAESTDWATTAEKLKALQARWKESGHLPRKQGDELWKRFRAACDKFFERRKPMLDARNAEELQNLAHKQELIARAQRLAANAPGEGGWGKAIGQLKDLQREWQDVGYVPRRDADAVYAGFRAACDALFAKRDDARDGEANAHRAELDGLRAEIAAITDGGEDRVTRALAARVKLRELDGRELSGAAEAMVRAVIAAEPEAVKGTELDPHALHARRAKLIAKAEELLPKQTPVAEAGADLAAQLKRAMRANAFGDLRFSGRDPVEVVDELRAQWADAGPVMDDADRAQAEQFAGVCKQVLDAAGASAKAERAERDGGERNERNDRGGDRGDRNDQRGDRGDRGDRGRRRRDRHDVEPPASVAVSTPPAPVTTSPSSPTLPALPTVPAPPVKAASVAAAAPTPTHDAPTAPTQLPFHPLPAPAVPAVAAVPAVPAVAPAAPAAAPEPARAKPVTAAPPMDELDTGWDMDDDAPKPVAAAAEHAKDAKDADAKDAHSPPSSDEMAGDGAAGGGGIDEPGWD